MSELVMGLPCLIKFKYFNVEFQEFPELIYQAFSTIVEKNC